MVNEIATYPYTYGADQKFNRKILVTREDNDPTTIEAHILARRGNKWYVLNTVPGAKIDVEMMSTAEKMREMLAARNAFRKNNYIPNEKLSSLSAERQNIILGELDRENGRRIEVINDIGGPSGYEKVVQLNIFDPR